MKKNLRAIFLTILLLSALHVSFCNAQKQAWKWYFGYNAAIDFSSGTPVPLFNSAMNQWEGCSSIADSTGELLFYTDGLKAWNKNHTQMPNGFGMLGDATSTQSALIVPKPGSTSIYYIFVTNGYDAHYSEVDMSLQGGLGDVTATKNILLTNNSAEKLAGVLQSNGIDFWVCIHENSNAKFQAYSVTSSGVNGTPVISTTGNSLNGNIGQLQFSPSGNKAAMATLNDLNFSPIHVFDFDATTGVFSFDFALPFTSVNQTYGVEFSPSQNLLCTTGGDPSYYSVHQWNLAAGSLADIIASDIVIGTTTGYAGSLQSGPDSKIYVAQENYNYVGVINNPDSIGVACDFVGLGVDLSPKNMGLGLPNFIASFFSSQALFLSATDTLVCQKFCLSFFDQSINNPTEWQWFFEGGIPSSSTDQNPSNICYNLPGTFDVMLVTTNAFGKDTLLMPDYITVNPTPLFPSITQNGYVLTSSPSFTYQWQLNSADISGATNQSYTVVQTGTYTVIVGDSNGCVNSASKFVLITGIDEVMGDADVSIFPNPSSGNFTIEITRHTASNGKMDDEFSIVVLNPLGQILFSDSKRISSHFKQEIDLHNLDNGIYFFNLQSGNFSLQKKIVISK